MKNVYSVYDAAAEAFLRPYFAETHGLAIRAFAAAVNDPQHQFAQHSDDFTLFHIGEFDEQTARLETISPHSLGNAVQFVDRGDGMGDQLSMVPDEADPVTEEV